MLKIRHYAKPQNVGGHGGFDYLNENYWTPERIKERQKKMNCGWKDKEKRLKVWKSVPIEVRQEIGRYMGKNFGGSNKLTSEEIEKRLNLIKSIDLTKFGWVQKVGDVLNLTHTQVKRFIDKYYNGEIYRR